MLNKRTKIRHRGRRRYGGETTSTMDLACMSHQPDNRDLKISMSSHKDVRIWMGLSTGAPLSTQHFLCNPGLMRTMASRLRHWALSSFKIV